MSDFKAQIGATIDLSEAKSQLDSFMNENRKIKVDVDTKGIDNLNMNSGNFAKAGQQAGRSFTKSLNSQMNNFKFDSTFAKMNSQMGMFSGRDTSWLNEAKRAMQEYKDAYNSLQGMQKNDNTFDIEDKKVIASFNKMTQASEQFKNAMAVVNTETTKTPVSIAKDFDKVQSLAKQISSTKIEIAGLDSNKNSNQISTLNAQLEEMNTTYGSLMETVGKGFSLDQTNKLDSIFDNTDSKIEKITAKTKDMNAALTESQSTKSAATSLVKDFQTVQNLAKQISSTKIEIAGLDPDKNTNQISTLNTQLTAMETKYGSLMETVGKGFSSDQTSKLDSIFKNTDVKIEQITAKTKDMNAALKESQVVNRLDATAASNKTLTWLNNNTKAAKDYGQALTELAQKQKNAQTKGELKSLNKEFKEITSTAALAGKTGNSWTSEFSRAFSQIGQFVGIYGVLQQGTQLAKQMVSEVINVDSALVELSKVSDIPLENLSGQFETATATAKELGTTISDVINSTADWNRLGYSLNESSELARVTSLYQTVGDNMTQQTASESLISTLKGFEMDASEALGIVDRINEVANNMPIDTAGISEALQRSASSMSAAGNSLEETIGLITAANSVVQDPTSVGTAFKTISMRVRGAATELEQAGLETDGMATSTAKLREEIMALSGVDIMLDSDTFKSTYDILDELSVKWQDLTDIQQASITELIAGKRQGNIMSALMTNFDIARESVDIALGSEGSAEKEFENYQKGIDFSIGKLKASFQELSTATIDSGFVKGAVDGATALLNILTQIVSVGGGIPAIFAGIGGVALFKNLD